jgi:hypothetical protein
MDLHWRRRRFDTLGSASLLWMPNVLLRDARLWTSLALLSAGMVHAQGPTQAKPGVAPPIERASDVPDPEKLRRSSSSVQRMRSDLSDVLGRLEEARATKDVVKLNCVNEKLTQVKGLLRISEQSDVALQEAVARKDTTAAEHEYTKVTIARGKSGQLRNDAEQCIGQLAFRTDENLTVEVQVPSGLPSGDPTNPPAPAPVTSSSPVASPIL